MDDNLFMISKTETENVIKKFFPDETIQESKIVEITAMTEKIKGFPIAGFRLFKPFKNQVRLVWTDNYIFIDSRYIPPVWQILFSYLLTIVILIAYFTLIFKGNVIGIIFSVPSIILLAIIIIFILQNIYSLVIYFTGMHINIYRKTWIKEISDQNTIKLDIQVPKYERQTIMNYYLKNTVLDFLGVTITSAPINISLTCKAI